MVFAFVFSGVFCLGFALFVAWVFWLCYLRLFRWFLLGFLLGRGGRLQQFLFKTTVLLRKNIGLGLQTTVFLRKNKVLARVGVAGLNIFLQNHSFAKETYKFSAKLHP